MNRPAAPPDPFEMDDAAYLLGALGPHERTRYEQHLQTCDSCRRSLTELAGLPGVLRRLPLEVVQSMDEQDPDEHGLRDGVEPAPPSVLTGLLDRVEREERGRRQVRVLRWAGALTTAAAAVVVGVLAATQPWEAEEPPVAAPPPGREIDLEPVGDTDLSGSVSLRDVAWGTRIELECEYPAPAGTNPYSAAPEYSLVVRDVSGESQQVATWNAVAGKELTIDAATAVRGPDIAWMEIRAQDGTPVLRTAD